MKASEVLRRYKAGERDFQRVNLRGQCFQGQDLLGADFSEADIRSTNFSDANLRGANFCGAKCGLQRRWVVPLTIISWLLAGISPICLFPIILLLYWSEIERIETWIFPIVLIAFLFFISCQGLRKSLIVAGVAGVAATGVALAATVFTKGVLLKGSLMPVKVTAGVAIGVAVVAAGVYFGWRALRGDERDVWFHSFVIDFAATGGTSFYSADLTDANFAFARLKSTDLRKANITRVRWYGAQMLDRVRSGETYLK